MKKKKSPASAKFEAESAIPSQDFARKFRKQQEDTTYWGNIVRYRAEEIFSEPTELNKDEAGNRESGTEPLMESSYSKRTPSEGRKVTDPPPQRGIRR